MGIRVHPLLCPWQSKRWEFPFLLAGRRNEVGWFPLFEVNELQWHSPFLLWGRFYPFKLASTFWVLEKCHSHFSCTFFISLGSFLTPYWMRLSSCFPLDFFSYFHFINYFSKLILYGRNGSTELVKMLLGRLFTINSVSQKLSSLPSLTEEILNLLAKQQSYFGVSSFTRQYKSLSPPSLSFVMGLRGFLFFPSFKILNDDDPFPHSNNPLLRLGVSLAIGSEPPFCSCRCACPASSPSKAKGTQSKPHSPFKKLKYLIFSSLK